MNFLACAIHFLSRRSTLWLGVALLGLIPWLGAGAVPAEPRTALVIGNGAYSDAPLRNPVNDARDMAAKLRELGFQVIERFDADRQTLRQALREFEQQLRQQRGVGLFYYAGHGVQLKGQNYLIPVGVDIRQEFEIPDEGVDADAVIREVEAHDRHAAASLRLMQAFGLRFDRYYLESTHQDVLTAQQAGRPADGPARYLDTHRGTKGGRDRLLPIDTPQREAAVAEACRVAIGPDDSVSDPRRTLAQAERRLRYVMERHGITRAGLKVVPHGLRHQGAADDYESTTGTPPPVAGGWAVDPALDLQARREIAARLGHRRISITNVYLGSRRAMPAEPPPPARGSDLHDRNAT